VSEEFVERDMKGATFRRVHLGGATFNRVSFEDARMQDVTLKGAVIRGAYLEDVEIGGDIISLRVNGVDVAPLIEAELDRLHPERPKMRPTDADGYREAWSILEQLWEETVARARALDPELLHERVNGEWSFIETLRHLAFATDAWISRALHGDPSPWHPLDLPWDEMPDTEGIPRDRDARPTLHEVLAVRAERQATVRQALAGLTDERLAESTDPPPEGGWPPAQSFPVKEVLDVVVNEEWWHRQFAERDLAVLEAKSS
jgi:uncharacterized protein YjbI with pentapeptide repeats